MNTTIYLRKRLKKEAYPLRDKDMTDPEEFYKKLMVDPETASIIKGIREKASFYGEDKDKFLGYVMGAIASLHSDTDAMVANVETVKFIMLLTSIEQGMVIHQKLMRESHKSEAARPV